MIPITRLATAAAIVLAVGAVSILALSNRGGGPGGVAPSSSAAVSTMPSPSVAASSAPLSTAGWIPFASTRYGYTIAYPPGWTATQAERAWAFDVDRLTTPLTTADHFLGGPIGNQVGVSGWSTDVPAGTSEDAWLTSYYANDATQPPNCGVTPDTFAPTTVDGHPARMATSNCDDTQAFVFIGQRVYIFGIWRDESNPSVTPYGGARRLLDAFLSTVTIPAPTTPTPSAS
jgi:hypothetical protein